MPINLTFNFTFPSGCHSFNKYLLKTCTPLDTERRAAGHQNAMENTLVLEQLTFDLGDSYSELKQVNKKTKRPLMMC